ncbi:MAG: sugar ABC transporter permease [Chloroflexi bacterium]|jgi:multiple sugar transport system permease protein|nr:sugar ABC transporter permease [Chloroflexota bacterium]
MRYRKITPYLFLLPMIVGLFVFRLGPIAAAVFASFTNWNVATAPVFIGLGNFRELFASQYFWLVLRNTVVFILIFTPGVMILAFIMAVLVNQKLKGIAFFRGLFFMPYVTTMVAIAMAFNWIFATRFGVLNSILTRWFNVSNPPAWLSSPTYALIAIAIVAIWKYSGFLMMIFLAGLQSIPADLYEAAEIDGANRLQQIIQITLPLLSPVTFFAFIITVIDAFRTFDVTYAMTGGGPNFASTTLAYYVYQNAFIYQRMGYASAISMILLILVAAATFVSFKLKDRLVTYAL